MHGPAHDRRDFSTQVEAVARGVRQLAQIGDPVLRDAVAAALRLRDGDMRLDPAARARMRRQVLAAISPVRLTFADHLMTVFAILAKPTPTLMRLLAVGLASVGLLAGATVASADSLPDEALYGFKLAGEQLRLGIASTPEDRAAVGISIAAHRLGEAERLAAAGRDDATIDVTAAYGLSLANAAAELASVERLKPKWGALVVQLQAQLAAQQDRVDAIAKRLAGDPRTAGAAAVLAAVGTRAGAEMAASAVWIAEDAAAVTTRLAAVAADRAARARLLSPRATAPAIAAAPASAVPDRSGSSGSLGGSAGSGVAAVRPAPADENEGHAERTAPARDATATRRPAATRGATPPSGARLASGVIGAPLDLAAAREAAQRAQRAAEQANRAALRARENSHKSVTPAADED